MGRQVFCVPAIRMLATSGPNPIRIATMVDTEATISQLEAVAAEKKLPAAAVENIRDWLTEPYLEEYAPQVAEHIASGMWRELEDAFWTEIPFGTGGRRGRMYPIGCNAINDRTIGESAQGLADYVKEHAEGQPLACAIAYDTRHRSRHFAELCSQIMAAAGFTVYFLDGYRSTPELSFAVRHKHCTCGIMITASHNPPEDNAVKVYWSSGGQLLPPHDADSIVRMQQVTWIKRIAFAQGMEARKITYCQEEVDAAYFENVVAQNIPGPRELKIVYSPLHGVGASSVPAVLDADGFSDVEVFGPHAAADPDFPNVPGHSANPENSAVFDIIIDRAKQTGAELIMATDPDCDRLGCAVPVSTEPGAPWTTLTGNQIAALLTDFLLATRQEAGELTPDHYVVKTLVTSELMRRVADAYGVQTAGNLLVGFKWIGGGDGRPGTRPLCLRGRRVLWFPCRPIRPGQRRRGGRHAVGRTGGTAEDRRAHAARQARRVVPPARLPHRANLLGANARREGHGRHEGPVGRFPQQPATEHRRNADRPFARLPRRHHRRTRRQAGAAGRANRRHGPSSSWSARATTSRCVPRAPSLR